MSISGLATVFLVARKFIAVSTLRVTTNAAGTLWRRVDLSSNAYVARDNHHDGTYNAPTIATPSRIGIALCICRSDLR
jgi:hypothetical protein